ncbi:hypothetical protein BDD43_1681 [Mucilaginibacter gracilis]|uniref:Lipoprotein n=1 Tax=Mucilaginibacter gracilis TaxID=423350 RepID=A0A495IZS4_9SPHI|nr:hypothetical protein [Mucilaginibacter gracilis]RKR81534.1 hypothetical protein BDD43_1681 [Mucilaginibacter gracilis]
MRVGYLLLITLLLTACNHGRKVNTSFYYWKTVYKQNATESAYLNHLHSNKLYVRIMDVDMDEDGINPVPVSPVTFQSKLPDTLQIVPVVFIVNDVLRNISKPKLNELAGKLLRFVKGKVTQAGKVDFAEMQIDCDWTAETRDNYFYLLRQIKTVTGNKTLSVTLRLHQLKNRKRTGVPPADKVLLMCYNMGNLRKYGTQNSIIELSELKKYAGENLSTYPMPMDIGLPLFSWAVAFRNKEYAGIDKRINFNILNDEKQFRSNGNGLYSAVADLPAYGLLKGDEIRWEDSALADVQAATVYISKYLKPGNINVVYFHLDDDVIKKYKYEGLQNTADMVR